MRRPNVNIYSVTHYKIAKDGIEAISDVNLKKNILSLTGRMQLAIGTAWPDFIERKFFFHYYDISKNHGGILRRINTEIRNLIKEWGKINYLVKSFRLGVLCHFLGDLCQPLHSASNIQEKKIHCIMENQVKDVINGSDKMFGFYKDETIELTDVNIKKYIKSKLINSNLHYKKIVDSFYYGHGLSDCYNEVKECYNSSCQTVKNVLEYIIKKV